MARKKKEEPVVVTATEELLANTVPLIGAPIEPGEPVIVVAPQAPEAPAADAGQSLYRDRSVAPRENLLTEGKANFETITNAARGILPSSET